MARDKGAGDAQFPPHLDYRDVIESIGDYAIFLLTTENVIASWNAGVFEVFGYEREEFLGRPGSMLFVPEDIEAGAPEWERITAEREGSASDDRWHLRRDGSRVWVNGVMIALKDEQGEMLGFMKILRDNTAQREDQDALRRARVELEQRVEERTAELRSAMDELRRREHLFGSIFRAGPFAAAVLDAEKDAFLEVNESFVRLTGFAAEEIVGAEAAARFRGGTGGPPAEDGDADKGAGGEDGTAAGETSPYDLANSLWRVGEADFRNREMQLVTRSGERRTVVASGVPVPLDRRGGRLVMFVDISERKRNEDELMQAIQDVMQDANWFSRSVVERLSEIRGGNVDSSRVNELTRRERQVLEQVARGRSNAEIAQDLGIAPQTVRNYITSVYEKIGVKSRVEAVVWARERGMGL